MKKIFNSSKRGIAVILTLCILIGIAGTCVHAAVVDETTQVTDEPTQELMPRMATRCGSSNDPLEQYFGANYIVTSTSGPWQYISGAKGITGGYNTTTGAGYVEFDDGTRQDFHVPI